MFRNAIGTKEIFYEIMQHYLYLILDILSFSVPFAYSFERKHLYFIKFWKPYFSSIFFMGLFFIIWDIYFVYEHVWWFNTQYIIGVKFLRLPVEEWLFFILIPFSSNFIHYSIQYFFPRAVLGENFSEFLNWVLFIGSAGIAFYYTDRIYTCCSFGIFSTLMLLQLVCKFIYFRRYIFSFVLILIPFLVVNSFLTGSFTPEAIVCYNNDENLGIRIGSIPIEDFFYCFSLLYSSLLLFEYLKSKTN